MDNTGTHIFLVSEPTAKMNPGQQMQVTYRIDKTATFTGTGVAISDAMLAVGIEGSQDAIYAAFKSGSSLYVKMGMEEFEEPLDGSMNALNALGECQGTLPPRP